MNNKRLISLTACLVLATVLGTSVVIFADDASETDAKAERHFQKANELRKVADHDAAIVEYEKAIELSPRSKVAQDAQYWIGQSHFSVGRLDAALSAFQGLIDAYPTSVVAPSAKQMIEQVQKAKEDNSLFEAVEKGDLEQLKLLISKGADVNLKNQEGMTPLHIAAREGNTDIAALLIKNRAAVNERANTRDDSSGWTPLHFAANKGNVDVVELLIGARAQINVHATWGHTPLEDACVHGHINVVKLLLAKGADIEAGDDWNATPLFAAVRRNYPEIVKLLLERGANVEPRIKPGRETPLHRAARENYLEVAELLLKAGAFVDSRDLWDFTPLHFAVRRGNQTMVELLLSNGANPWRRRHIQDIVSQAMDMGQKEMVQFLVDKGFGHSAIHVAAYLGDLDEVKRYLAGGGNINAKDSSQLTLLDCAIAGGQTTGVEFLISKGADLNLQNGEGLTALHRAVRQGRHAEIARMLLDKGADVTIKSRNGGTPLYEAVRSNGFDDLEVIEMIIAKGADVNARIGSPPSFMTGPFVDGFTPLHSACLGGKKSKAEVLIAHGADVNAKTKNGDTPMSLAKRRGHEQIIELLRKHGAKE